MPDVCHVPTLALDICTFRGLKITRLSVKFYELLFAMKVRSSKVSMNGEVEPCNQQSTIILEATRMSLGSTGDGKVKRTRTTTRCQK
jgi:hypothetical protein